MYALIGPGVTGIYHSLSEVNEVQTIYPYSKVRWFATEDECQTFIAQNKNNHTVEDIQNYGDVFDTTRVVMSYYVVANCVYYNFDTSKFGRIRLQETDGNVIVNNRPNNITARVYNIQMEPRSIFSHVAAIHRGLILLGDLVDVELIVPDHSIFYALFSYTGDSKTICRAQRYIKSRTANLSITVGRRSTTRG